MHYFYREMDFRETEKPTLIVSFWSEDSGICYLSQCSCTFLDAVESQVFALVSH